MIKAIFFDLDGTLLNSKKMISPKTKEALVLCKKKGIRLFIATARPPLLDKMLGWDEETVSLFDGGSYYNGGCVILGACKEYWPVSDEIVKNVIDHSCEYDHLNVALQLKNEKHAFRFFLDQKSCKSWGAAPGDCLSLEEAGRKEAIKILLFYANLIDSVTKIDNKLVDFLQEYCLHRAQFYLTDKGKCIQIMGKSVNKLKSVESIRKRLHLDENEVAVFGDDVNDIEMLSAFSYSFAMGNAENHVKEKAKYVTLNHNCDGIYHVITQILKLV